MFSVFPLTVLHPYSYRQQEVESADSATTRTKLGEGLGMEAELEEREGGIDLLKMCHMHI